MYLPTYLLKRLQSCEMMYCNEVPSIRTWLSGSGTDEEDFIDVHLDEEYMRHAVLSSSGRGRGLIIIIIIIIEKTDAGLNGLFIRDISVLYDFINIYNTC